MEDKRLIDIEIKLAHQESTIADLNQVLIDQQKQLTRLERVCDMLGERLGTLSRAGADPAAGAGD